MRLNNNKLDDNLCTVMHANVRISYCISKYQKYTNTTPNCISKFPFNICFFISFSDRLGITSTANCGKRSWRRFNHYDRLGHKICGPIHPGINRTYPSSRQDFLLCCGSSNGGLHTDASSRCVRFVRLLRRRKGIFMIVFLAFCWCRGVGRVRYRVRGVQWVSLKSG